MTVRIAIVGGGIAGLSCAVAVSHLCPDVHLTLLERRPTLQAVGAGIVLWPNAIRALQYAGVPEEQLDAVSLRGVSGGVRASDGRWLSRSDIDVVTATVGRTAALRRADLLELLRTHVPEGVLQRGCAVTEVSAGGTLTWENAEGRVTEQFDLVVAADGLRSTVRGALWPGVTPVDSGVTAWRWLAPDVGPGEREGFEMWGPEGVMGVVPLAGAQRYLYAAAPSHVVTGNPHDDLRRFAHWADPIPSLIANATDVLCHPLADLPRATSYVRGTVVLIGDAAHGMLPFLGQGACMGIEDAATLATLLASRGASARRASGRTTPSACFAGHTASASSADATASSDRASTLPHILRRFDAVRVPRCRQMQARSRDAGRMALLRNPLLVAARNAALRVVPAGLAVQALADVTRWSPPE